MTDVMDKPKTGPISTRRHGDVLVILSNNPPVNALSTAVRQGLVDAIAQAEADEGVKAVVIACEGQTFFAGADITEFGKPPQQPWLPMVVDTIENCAKPVVAAIHGTALGGGLEVALACHYRVADPSAKLGTPEVKLGLLPGAGGTQRLPRVAGVRKALEMCATGNSIGAKEGFECGLVDRLVEGELVPHAVAYAEEVRDIRPLPKSSERQDRLADADPGLFDAFRKENAKRFRGFDAPLKNIEAVKVATEKPYSEGVIEERKLFMELMGGAQSKAQQYFFFAERKAAKIEGLPEGTEPRPIRKVGVVGAGTMGGGISMNFLSAGIPVTIVEMSQDALDRGTSLMRKYYEASAAKGKLTEAQVSNAMGLLTPTLDFSGLADCDLIIEAVYENMDVKKEVFARLDATTRPGAILASNTSYLDINEIAASISRPGDVVGMHFFSPANIMKLLEVVRGDKTAPDVLLTAMGLGKKIRKVPVVAGVCHGFIGNRMLMPRQVEGTKLLLEGATPEQVDRVHVEFGMPMGPFQMADLAGVDIGWHRDPTRIDNVRDALCAIDRWGQKKGAGFYDYDEKRRPTPSPVVQTIIEDFAAKQGVERREISDQEIVERTLYTMVNEGAKILEEGIAQRASDIDVVWVYGYGWPVYRGGPMFWADSIGLADIVEGLKRQVERMKPDFSFSRLLLDKAEKGESFTR
jgi:3-hydroxyacyl-CoA dehydrogenase